MKKDFAIKNGTCILPSDSTSAASSGSGSGFTRVITSIAVANGKIVEIGDQAHVGATEVFDAKGLIVMPGAIDSQVHFREPGLTHKEDLESGTRGAVLGGITAVFEMPNTKPSTTTAAMFEHKLSRAQGRVWSDIAFFIGAAPENIEELAQLELHPNCCAVKIFMGSSTGSLLIENEAALLKILQKGRRRVAVHCEDEQRLRDRKKLVEGSGDPRLHPFWRDETTAYLATSRLVRCAREAGRRVHVLHVTTAEEMAFLKTAKDIATVETLPQHLTLSAPECYERLGTFAQMNPPIREKRHQDALWRAISDGTVDVLGSDHAPHTRAEKLQAYPNTPSGMTGVQTMLPLMLNHVNAGRLSLERLTALVCRNPARLYQAVGKGAIRVGYDADFTIVDMNQEKTIKNSWIASKSGWTPFDEMKVRGWPKATIVRGQIVMREDQLIGRPSGDLVKFRAGKHE
jgi:dihydroorotase